MKLCTSILIMISFQYTLAQVQPDSNFLIEKEILEINREMESTFNKGDYEKVGAFYAENAAMVGNRVEIIGKNNLEAYWGKFKNANEWVLENIQISILSNDVVLQRGFSNITYYQGNELQNSRSIFSLVWIKTDDGWKIMLDHFSPR